MLMGAADLSVSDADLDLLDAYLLSDQSPPECLLLSDLDGFLTGVAIGPEVVMPSEWLPHVWGGDEPVFDDPAQASAILGTIMGRYNTILREVAEGAFGPIFWETVDGTVIAADWAEGFMQAAMTPARAAPGASLWSAAVACTERPSSGPSPPAHQRRVYRVRLGFAPGRVAYPTHVLSRNDQACGEVRRSEP